MSMNSGILKFLKLYARGEFDMLNEKDCYMTREEKIKWLTNLRTDIGKSEHRELWHYEQALTEIIESMTHEYMTEPVMHGEWHNYKDEHYCSNCKETIIRDWDNNDRDDWYEYCPNCGARMDGDAG